MHPLKITSTLADYTRYSIYEHFLKTKEAYSVAQIAALFNIHSNVARLHLTKLTEINAIEATYEKSGKGGRPGRRYKAANNILHITYPRKDHAQLLEWLLLIVDHFGDEALSFGKNIAYQEGFRKMQALLPKRNLTNEQKFELLSAQASLIGYVSQYEITENQVQFEFTMYNCPFTHMQNEHSMIICTMHEHYLKGQIDVLFDSSNLIQVSSMASHCAFCLYKVSI